MKKSLLPILFLIGMLFVSVPMISLAQFPANNSNSSLPANNSNSSLPANYSNSSTNNFTLQNPLGFSTICGLVKAIFNALLALGVPVAVLFLVYAGFKFIIARGNSEALQKARDNLINVVLGIGIFLGAWLLGQIIAATINSLSQAAGQPSVTGSTCN